MFSVLPQKGATAMEARTGVGGASGPEAAIGPALANARPNANRIGNARDQREGCESMVSISCAGNPPTANASPSRPADYSNSRSTGRRWTIGTARRRSSHARLAALDRNRLIRRDRLGRSRHSRGGSATRRAQSPLRGSGPGRHRLGRGGGRLANLKRIVNHDLEIHRSADHLRLEIIADSDYPLAVERPASLTVCFGIARVVHHIVGCRQEYIRIRNARRRTMYSSFAW